MSTLERIFLAEEQQIFFVREYYPVVVLISMRQDSVS